MMRPFESTISIEQALGILRDAVIPLDRVERVTIDDAAGRVLASDIAAPQDVPAFDRAAMDGYAVRARDTHGSSRAHPVALRVLGRVYAGETADVAVDTGTCVEIATGAPLAPGADAVVMVEETQAPMGASKIGNDVQVFSEVRSGQHVVSRAADMHAGDVLMSLGADLTASRLGAIAAIGIATVDVYARPIVAILPTGDELTPLGTPLPPGHVYDVNRYTLASVVRQHGGVPRVYPTVADNLDAVRAAISRVAAQANSQSANRRRARGSDSRAGSLADSLVGPRSADAEAVDIDAESVDILVLTGGSSVGEHDLVIDILREQGEVLFHGIAVKPGKPTALARIGRLLVLGMPGNPTSCLSNAYVLLVPLLRATGRLPAHQPKTVRATLASNVESPRDRYQFMPVRLENGRAVPTFKGSGEITSLSRADGYFEIPTDVSHVDAGTPVDVTLY
jgi:molybdopterin molybdotransferase